MKVRRYLRRSFAVALLACASAGLSSSSATRASSVQEGPRPASPPPFLEPGHVHAKQGSIIGKETPHLIPTDVAAGLMLRAISLAHRNGGDDSLLDTYFANIERASGSKLLARDRAMLLAAAEWYSNSTLNDANRSNTVRQAAAQSAWRQLTVDLPFDKVAALDRFVEQHVKPKVTSLE